MNSECIEKVGEYTATAKGIAFDTCHKIYILMDDRQMDLMKDYGYDPLISSSEMTADEMTETVAKWYDESCGLRFVNAVATVGGDANDGFTSIVPQGYDDESECLQCGDDIFEGNSEDGVCENCLMSDAGYCEDCNRSFYYEERSDEDYRVCEDCYREKAETEEEDE